MAPEQYNYTLERQYLDAVALGLADAVAGQTVDHEKVADWLETWGTEHETEPPM